MSTVIIQNADVEKELPIRNRLQAIILIITYLKSFSEKMNVRNRFILPEELNRLVEASRKTRAKFYMPALIYLGAEHGASRQELIKLNWEDINFDYAEYGLIRFFGGVPI